jgi:hypothetical protein
MKMKHMKKLWPIVALASLATCSGGGPKPPGKADALQKINSRYAAVQRSITLDIGRTGTDCYFAGNGPPIDIGYRPDSDVSTIVAVRAGYVEVKPAETNRWDVTLTDKGKALASSERTQPVNHRTGNGCDEQQISFPIARAHVSELGEPVESNGFYEYSYLWKWEFTGLASELRQNGSIFARLTPKQRTDLQEAINVELVVANGPKLPVPVPAEAENPAQSGTAVLKSQGGKWMLEVRQ